MADLDGDDPSVSNRHMARVELAEAEAVMRPDADPEAVSRAADEWLDCPKCGWGRATDELCTNPECEDSPNAIERTRGPTPEEKEAALREAYAASLRVGNRAMRRGNPTGSRGRRVVHTRPVEMFHDGLTPEQRAQRAKNEREEEARRRAKLRKRRHEQRTARKRTR